MTPAEKNVLKSLVAVAWADGQMGDGESGVIEGLLCGFDASEAEEAEILEYARTPRSMSRDIPLGELSRQDKELLLSNAALLTQLDGVETDGEQRVMAELVSLLGFSRAEVEEITRATRDGVRHLSTKPPGD